MFTVDSSVPTKVNSGVAFKRASWHSSWAIMAAVMAAGLVGHVAGYSRSWKSCYLCMACVHNFTELENVTTSCSGNCYTAHYPHRFPQPGNWVTNRGCLDENTHCRLSWWSGFRYRTREYDALECIECNTDLCNGRPFDLAAMFNPSAAIVAFCVLLNLVLFV